ncbi:unnamed protein product [Rotaria sordida]|uniref:Uncharacterized protein n=1 Tax=Rotaria sordida TaxID=392033 RepID=A0A820BDX1_9BILA|nr:unnamed protein product [Rotaria sordida]CAF4200423.1 unnamed protein product [Rotaria sordida]CAF4257214.1 unnamed protein product [Rotaria sordida]
MFPHLWLTQYNQQLILHINKSGYAYKTEYENKLAVEYRQYQSTKEIRLGELQLELKLKTFEFDRLQLLYEENLKSLKTI